MEDNKDTIIVFTARSPDRILKEGGSQAWVLNPARAKLCKWLVCTQNRHNPDHEFSDATEPHGSGFLLGKISGIRPSLEEGAQGRWLIEIDEYVRINNHPNLWDRWRNPVRYTSLAKLKISADKYKFRRMSPMKSASQQAFIAGGSAMHGVPSKQFGYAREKFWQAVDVLATSDRSIQTRLASAAMYLIRLKPDDMPDEYRDKLNEVLQNLTKEKPIGSEGTIEATTSRMASEEGMKTASDIVSIYTGLHGGI